jgi:hypothetical protein
MLVFIGTSPSTPPAPPTRTAPPNSQG